MKFEEAFNEVFEIEKKRSEKNGFKFSIESKTAKILAFFWNMLTVSNGIFDDIVYIDKNNNIISVPFKRKEEIPQPKGKKSKPSENEDLENGTKETS